MTRFFVSIYTYFLSRRKLLLISLVLLLMGCLVALLRMEYKEDIAAFLPNNEANERINAVYQHIGNSNKLIIFFSVKDSAKNSTVDNAERIMAAIDNFTLLLTERDSLHTIPEIISRVDESKMFELVAFIQQNAPYFLTEADYARLDTLLSEPSFVASQLEEDKRLLMLPSGNILKQNIVADPLHLFSPLLSKLQDFRIGEQENVNNGYIFTNNGQKGMVILTSPYGVSETAKNATLLAMLYETMQEVEVTSAEVSLSCFGAPAIAVTNAEQIKQDSTLAIALSAILILILLIYFFRNARNIFLIFLSVLFGWLLALALLALFKGSISIIAVGIGSIFIGIAINYPLHLIDHIKHQPNTKHALQEIISPLLIGNITTVSAFLSLVFLSSDAMRDLGIFGSLLLVGTILFVLIYLPHLVKVRAGKSVQENLIFGRLASFSPEKKKWIVWPVLLLTGWFLYLSQFTAFESDMNQINYMANQQREDMRDMMASLEKKDKEVVYFISEGSQLNEALTVYEKNTKLLDNLRQEGLIESVAGIGSFLISKEEQQQRIQRWNNFWELRREKLLQQMEKAANEQGFKQGSFASFSQLLHADFVPQDENYFTPLTSLLANNYLISDNEKSMVINLLYCDKEKITDLEKALIQASPGTFYFDVRDIGQRMIDALSNDFNYVLYVCGFIVFIFLTLSFGRLELSLLSFLPLLVSWVWILGLMQLGDIRFNIVNIILATFIFGQGDDYTIFITEGLMYEYTYRRKMLAAYKNSIILSAIIMFIGIGTLIFAKHPALRSLAEVTVVGMFSVVMMAYIIPPLLFRWLTKNKKGYREVPLTIKRLLFSIYVFAVFLIGCFFITIASFVLLGFGRRKQEKQKLRYHSLLRWVALFVIQRVPGVKFNYENLSNETFEKPAVIISNHQSHLDLMCLMMLTPRLIILTNDWVWNNPFFGRLIKYADFYPVSNGVEQSLEKISESVKNGYSVVVFPEGTRSENCSILRFHRGAFYIAETLKMDILPVFIHGAGNVLPKKDFMLRQGAITVQVHPRIAIDDARYENNYAARTKQMRHYYRQTFAALSQQLETAAYFKSFVLHNYFYKGAGIERSVRTALKKTNCYSQRIDTYKGNGPVLIENNGNGEFSFLFALVHKHIQVIATEQDEDKVALARNCAGLPANLTVYKDEELPKGLKFENVMDVQVP